MEGASGELWGGEEGEEEEEEEVGYDHGEDQQQTNLTACCLYVTCEDGYCVKNGCDIIISLPVMCGVQGDPNMSSV